MGFTTENMGKDKKMILRKGRIKKEMLKKVAVFASSISRDRILAEYDIIQSIAHTKALLKAEIITPSDSRDLISSLQKLKANLHFLDGQYDDIHMAVEENLGDTGKKLHAGRSRNDQIACDMRMYVRDKTDKIINGLKKIIKAINKKDMDSDGRNVFLPAYTHLQRAQPVDLSTYLGVYNQWFKRDIERFKELYKRVNKLPLGSAAGASSNIKLDRAMIAEELGFDGVIENPMDAVSSRDYILEFANNISILGIHFSRMAEEFILFSTREFSFIELDESIADTSSIMPQKKNPDCLELIRSASGRLIGTAINLAVVMKGLPLTYNRDMQDDKEIFVSAKTVLTIIDLIPDILDNITFNTDKMAEAASDGFTDAADFAEYLVLKKGMEFRTAHQLTGTLIRKGLDKGYSNLADFPLKEIKEVIDNIDEDVFEFIDVKNAVRRRLYGKVES